MLTRINQKRINQNWRPSADADQATAHHCSLHCSHFLFPVLKITQWSQASNISKSFEWKPSVNLVIECISNTKSISHTISANNRSGFKEKRIPRNELLKHFFHRKYKLYHTLAWTAYGEHVVYHMINAPRPSTPRHIQSKSRLVVLVKRSERPDVNPLPLWAWVLAFWGPPFCEAWFVLETTTCIYYILDVPKLQR